ncbi:MAG: DUF4339 domain-containing protein [Gemmataceae bacterium]|nr:DUF4339 domain-containing protein [Gemmataceae bacterium]
MSGWYVKRDDKKYGPYSSTQLVEMAKQGQVLPLDWVAGGEAGQWMPASQVKGQFGPSPQGTIAPPSLPVGASPTPLATSEPMNLGKKLLGAIPARIFRPVIGMIAVIALGLLVSFFSGSLILYFLSFIHVAAAVVCIVLATRLRKFLYAPVAAMLTTTVWGWYCFSAIPLAISIPGLLAGIAVGVWSLFVFRSPEVKALFADAGKPGTLDRLGTPVLAGAAGGLLVVILGISGLWNMASGPKTSGGKGGEARWAKAVRVSGAETPKWEGGKSPIPGSRDDFLAAMELMGGLRGHTFQEKGITKVQMAFQCDEQKWHEVFGKPEMLSDGYDSFIRQKYQRWRHKLSDGPLTLTGNIFVYQGKTQYQTMQAWFD